MKRSQGRQRGTETQQKCINHGLANLLALLGSCLEERPDLWKKRSSFPLLLNFLVAKFGKEMMGCKLFALVVVQLSPEGDSDYDFE